MVAVVVVVEKGEGEEKAEGQIDEEEDSVGRMPMTE